MAKSSIQGFVELASGLGEMTRARAAEAVGEILELTANAPSSSKKVAKQANKLAEEFVSAAETNRQQITRLIRRELENAMSGLDLGTVSAEVESLRRRVQDLAGQVEALATTALKQGEDAVAAGLAALPGAVSPGESARRLRPRRHPSRRRLPRRRPQGRLRRRRRLPRRHPRRRRLPGRLPRRRLRRRRLRPQRPPRE